MVANVTSLTPFIAPHAGPRPAGGEAVGEQTRAGGPGESGGARSAVVVDAKSSAIGRSAAQEAAASIDLALAAAREIRGALSEARAFAERSADPAAPDEARAAQEIGFRAALQRFDQLLAAAPASVEPLLSEEGLSVSLADGDRLALPGLGLTGARAEGGALYGASVGGQGKAADAVAALDSVVARLDSGAARLTDVGAKLVDHASLLARVEGALRERVDSSLDAEGARLLALQVKQGLAQSDAPIANVAPNEVLGLFRH